MRRFGYGFEPSVRATRGSVRSTSFHKSASCISLSGREARNSPLVDTDDQRSESEFKRPESGSSSQGEDAVPRPEFYPIQCPRAECHERFPSITQLNTHLFNDKHASSNSPVVINEPVKKEPEPKVRKRSEEQPELEIKKPRIASLPELLDPTQKPEDLSARAPCSITKPVNTADERMSSFLNAFNSQFSQPHMPPQSLKPSPQIHHFPNIIQPQPPPPPQPRPICSVPAWPYPDQGSVPSNAVPYDASLDIFKQNMQKLFMAQNAQKPINSYPLSQMPNINQQMPKPQNLVGMPGHSPSNFTDQLSNSEFVLFIHMVLLWLPSIGKYREWTKYLI
ncbi:hypothetical protein Ciccas_000076 [Cichlidogyrus casuarinus]|uniref:C2H2-type domain-containing protein n=1 Tax=Cichlidogyrus casuarinus TaxID=1844966 RepID=A0ABD2QNZ0_9PLAT